VVDTEEELALREVHEERDKIAAAALNFEVIALRDAVDAKVRLGAAGHGNGYFFAEEKIGIFAESLRAIDGVMVGEGDDGHAALLATVVNGVGLVVRLLAEASQARGVAHAGSNGVEMKVASHGFMLDGRYEQSMKSERNEHES
jgi:hypothetical protein